jgi:predicted alpha/beta superfamily hydrolase
MQIRQGEGNQYIEFIATTLKSYIDKNYRTQKDAQHTFIAGSSHGRPDLLICPGTIS